MVGGIDNTNRVLARGSADAAFPTNADFCVNCCEVAGASRWNLIWRLGLRLSWRGMKSLLAAGFLLGCMLAGAQSERQLPNAPAAASVTVERVPVGFQQQRSNSEWQASSDSES